MDFDGINSVILPNETIWPELDVKHNWADGLLEGNNSLNDIVGIHTLKYC